MMNVADADEFCGDESRMGVSNTLWRDFQSYRDQWQYKLSPSGVRPVPLWYMVEHGWHHAEMLYASIPDWIRVLETNLSGRDVIDNGAEWFVLAAAAYLHDAGMRMPSAEVDEFTRAARTGDETVGADLISARVRGEIAAGSDDHPLLDSRIRKLHPDLGAWWIARPGERLIPHPEDGARAVAEVVRLHGSSAAEERSAVPDMQVTVDGKKLPVRVGMLASLIAIADACLVGREWVCSGDEVRHQERERQQLIKELSRRQHDGTLSPKDQDTLNLLNEQARHVLKHRAVRVCQPTPTEVVVVPADFEKTWWKQTTTLQPGNAHKDKSYEFGELVKWVARDIRAELKGATPALGKAFAVNPLPAKVRIARSARGYHKLREEVDRLSTAEPEPTAKPHASASVLSRAPLDRCETSRIFPDKVEELLSAVRRGERIITVEGVGGIGKTRVVAGLFDPSLAEGIEARWFSDRGESDRDAVVQSISSAIREEPAVALTVVFDERHDMGLDTEFFKALLGSAALAAMLKAGWQIVLAIRPDTARALEGQLGHACSIRLEEPVTPEGTVALLHELARARLGQDPSLDQMDWLRQHATDEETGLLKLVPLVVDMVLAEFLRLHPHDYRDRCDLQGLGNQQLIYRRLVVSPDDHLAQTVMEAMAKAGELTTRLPLWLITAAVRCMGDEWAQADPRDIHAKLHDLTETGLVAEPRSEPWRPPPREWEHLPTRQHWGFVHDLIPEAIGQQIDRRRAGLATEERILDSARLLVSELACRGQRDYEAALWMWSALCVERGDGLEALVGPLVDAAHDLVATGKTKDETICWLTARTLYWTFMQVRFRRDYDATCMLTPARRFWGIMAETATEELILRDARVTYPEVGGLFVDIGHRLTNCISATRREVPSVWEIVEGEEKPLRELGQRAVRRGLRDLFEGIASFDERVRLCQLCAWAQRWVEAGDGMREAIRSVIRDGEPFAAEIITRMELAVACYLQAGDRQRAAEAYQEGQEWAESAMGEAAGPLVDVWESKQGIVGACTQPHLSWSDLEVAYNESVRSTDDSKMFVISVYPSHGVASQVVHRLRAHGWSASIAHTTGLDHLTDLGPALGYILIGLPSSPGVRRLLSATDLSEERDKQVSDRLVSDHCYTAEGLSVGDVPVVWLAGLYPRIEGATVRAWLADGGLERFVERIKAAHTSPESPGLRLLSGGER